MSKHMQTKKALSSKSFEITMVRNPEGVLREAIRKGMHACMHILYCEVET